MNTDGDISVAPPGMTSTDEPPRAIDPSSADPLAERLMSEGTPRDVRLGVLLELEEKIFSQLQTDRDRAVRYAQSHDPRKAASSAGRAAGTARAHWLILERLGW